MDAYTNRLAPLRGRATEIDAIRASLEATREGRGHVTFVEGGRGLGKSRLLGEAVTSKAATNVQTIDLTNQLGTIEHVRTLELALDCNMDVPHLAIVDDAHRIDPAVVTALHVLLARLQHRPIFWLITFRDRNAFPELSDLVVHALEHGARVLSLQPLGGDEVAAVIADNVGAEPVPNLLTFADAAGGIPGLLAEWTRGAIEEELITFDGGRAHLLAPSVPERIRDLVRDDLAQVSALARAAALAAAVLGPYNCFEHLTSMLDLSPTALFELVDELERVALVTGTRPGVDFRNELLRATILESMCPSARRALQRQAIAVLLEAGIPPVDLALDLAVSAEPGDRAAVATLMATAQLLCACDADGAADLARLASDLTTCGNDTRPAVVAQTVLLLSSAGRAEEAEALANDLLSEGVSSQAEGEILLNVARMPDLAPERRAAAAQAALKLPDLSVEHRARHAAALAVNVLSEGRRDTGRELLAQAERFVVDAGDLPAGLILDAGRIQLAFMDGMVEEALQLLNARCLRVRDDDEHSRRVELLHAELLIANDDFDGALALADDRIAGCERQKRWSERGSWLRFRGRLLLQAGRVPQASSTLQDAIDVTMPSSVTNVGDAAALAAIGRIAIAEGNHGRARELVQLAESIAADRPIELQHHASWLRAQHALANDDAARARDELTRGHAPGSPALPVLMVDTADLAIVARIARDSGDATLAGSTLALADAWARKNPSVPSIAATAAHARGLLESSSALLQHASELLGQSPRRLAHASSLEDYGMALLRDGNRTGAVAVFRDAFERYSNAAAVWDAARLRRRLRALGVHCRRAKAVRTQTGWAGLTDSELAVAQLVADGLTNRKVAEKLFVSPHTVGMHLRHVFTKLNVNSRVELTRLAFEQNPAA